MTLWSILVAALAAATALLSFLYRRRRHKQDRLQLRLLAGRSHLLGEELHQAMESLERFGQGASPDVRAQTSAALDHLHLALIERQAHLQNCEELALLQQRRVALLTASWQYEAQAPPSPVRSDAPPATTSRPAPPIVRDRRQIENQLLTKIEELQKNQETARKPPPAPKKSGSSPRR